MNTVRSIEENADGLSVTLLYTGNNLAAGSAGCDGPRQEAGLIPCSYCQGMHRLVRILSVGGKKGSTLGTQAGGEGHILLIAANDNRPVSQADGSSYTEAGIWRITT